MKGRVLQAFLYVLCIALFASIASARSAVRYTVRIPSADTSALGQLLERENFDVAGRDRERKTVSVIVSVSDLRRLRAMGLEPQIVGGPDRGIPPGYEDFDTIAARLRTLADTYPTISRMVDVGAEFGVGPTAEGRPLIALKISDNVDRDEDEPALLIVSGHHAREIVTPVLALRIMERLLDRYGVDERITRIVDENEIWIAPVWNPDGYAHVFEADSYWRRNRSALGFGLHGADLNRNYPFGWNGLAAGSTDPTVETYRGRFPASEKETQNMLALGVDRRFAKVLDFHSHGREVLYTYNDPSSMPEPVEDWYMAKAAELSIRMGYGGRIRKPSAEGEHYQWQLNELGGFCFLVETADAFHPPHRAALDEAERIWPGVAWFLDSGIPLKGHVTETVTGRPIEADIEIAGLVYPAGDRHRSGGAWGRFHHFVPPGRHEVTVSAPGYAARTVNVEICEGESTTMETQLGSGPALTVAGRVSPGENLTVSFDYPGGAGHHYFCRIVRAADDTGAARAALVPNWSGVLDRSGRAEAILPIADDPSLIGQSFQMAYFTFTKTWNSPTAASASVTLTVED